jgi:hypothetical protein
MKIYCSTCKTEREAKDVQTVVLENGRPAEEGFCVVCGAKLLQIVFPNSCQ